MTRARTATAALVLALAVAVMLWLGGVVVDRVAHPRRYETSGLGRIAPGAYVTAARRVMGVRDRVARLTMPLGDGPAIVTTRSTLIYLDPPTARVLDVAPARSGGQRPAIEAAQPVGSVVSRARSFAKGGALRRVDWPTARGPDWTVWFDDADTPVKVADDSDVAAAVLARRTGGGAALTRLPDGDRLGIVARLAILLVAVAAAVGALAVLRGSGGRLTVRAARAPGRRAAPASARSAPAHGERDRSSP